MEHEPREKMPNKPVKVLENVDVHGVALAEGVSGRVRKSRFEFDTTITVRRGSGDERNVFTLFINGVEIESFEHGSEFEQQISKALGRAVTVLR